MAAERCILHLQGRGKLLRKNQSSSWTGSRSKAPLIPWGPEFVPKGGLPGCWPPPKDHLINKAAEGRTEQGKLRIGQKVSDKPRTQQGPQDARCSTETSRLPPALSNSTSRTTRTLNPVCQGQQAGVGSYCPQGERQAAQAWQGTCSENGALGLGQGHMAGGQI